MREIFFDHAQVAKKPNGEITIVLQVLSVPGGQPAPVGIIQCRTAGALALIEAIRKALE